MKLIKIEAFGFKSFADRATLHFDGGVVGIVGPNGSGKSNINDAVRWVLGEQSSKALRGDSMDDVIFAGSKVVEPMNKAEVTLTFDNSNRTMKNYGDFITISRVLERGKGSNLYYIDGSIARSKDIKDIAMETGMSKESLAIISQGTISQIAQSSSEERRKIFEEAAGTSKYKVKKEEALRKLDSTKSALDRIKTVVNELNRQLEPLEKQAKNAQIFIEKTNELKDVEIGLLVEDLLKDSEKVKSLSIDINAIEKTTTDLNEKIRVIEDNSISKNNYITEVKLQINELNKRINNYNDELRQLEVNFEKEKQRRDMLISGNVKATSEQKVEAYKKQLFAYNSELKNYSQTKIELDKIIDSKKIEYSNLSMNITRTRNSLTEEQDKYTKVKANLDMFIETKRQKTNLFKGTKTIIENSSVFNGYIGPVNQLITVHNKYIKAIEAVLQSSLQHIVVDKSEVAVKAIEFLKKNSGGRATFIPLSSIKEKTVQQSHLFVLPSLDGYINIASNLVDIDSRYNNLKEFLLGNIIIADNIQNANKIAKVIENKYMIATLDGDIIRVGGVMTGGESNHSSNLLGLDNNIEELTSILPGIKAEIDKYTQQYSALDQKRELIVNEINGLEINKVKTDENLRHTRDQFETLKANYELISNEKIELSEDVNFESSIEKIKLDKMRAESELKAKIDQSDLINEEINKINNEKTENERILRNSRNDFSRIYSEKAKLENNLSYSQKRLSEHYELTLEKAEKDYILSIPIEQAREVVKTLQNEIKALGNINLDAIKSYEEVSLRYENLKSSEDELSEAHNILINAINEMDKIIISKMRSTVELVNNEFNEVFRSMFGGGFAKVEFIDPNNILESGIDIIAQPPGKSIKNLKLFSGGEKALISISLLFAILKAKPLPLCILDEVEAALDETNVVRFADFLQKLKETTQFIVITHRHATMSRVDRLYGATMQKRGVTSFFGVELESAKKLVQTENATDNTNNSETI